MKIEKNIEQNQLMNLINYEPPNPVYLNHLNYEQKDAVLYCNGPELVSAGAGSGKTRVLTYKIAYLIDIKCIKAENLLALTFTNKAANEMRKRIYNLIDEKKVKNLNIGTFHSIFSRILRENIQKFNIKTLNIKYEIIDEKEKNKIIKKILCTENYEEALIKELENKILKPEEIKEQKNRIIKENIRKISERISDLKNNARFYDEYKLKPDFDYDKYKLKNEDFPNLYEKYCIYCQENNKLDFEDLLLYPYILFNKNKNILERFQEQFKYILVDEYQDTNHVQFELIKMLSYSHKNICVVGDDNQSIYGFRGASLNNLEELTKAYKNIKIFKLQINYRSKKNITEAANSIIKNNKNQIPKKIEPFDKSEFKKIQIIESYNQEEECEKVIEIINNLKKDPKFQFSDVGILYRVNAQSNMFVKKLTEKNIPHKVVGRINFYENKIIKLIISYLKYILNQRDDIALKKIINNPTRGIGDKSIKKIFEKAKEKNITGWEYMNCEEIKNEDKQFYKKVRIFVDLIVKLKNFKKTQFFLHQFIEDLIKEIKLNESNNDPSIINKIDQFLNIVKNMENEFLKYNKEKLYSLENFLEDITLNIYNEGEDIDENEEKKNKTKKPIETNTIKLLTIHAAKGLEFEYVFIVGAIQDNYPHFKDINNIYEERRIFYVALTRAKINCFISYYQFENAFKPVEKSQFIEEIGKNNFDDYNENIYFSEYINNNDKNVEFLHKKRNNI